MSEQLYTIQEETLTDIADALRGKVGETKIIDVYEHLEVPEVTIAKSSNANGHNDYSAAVIDSERTIVYIPTAVAIRVKLSYSRLYGNQALYVVKGMYEDGTPISVAVGDSVFTSTVNMYTIELPSDAITFEFVGYNKGDLNGKWSGYYAECTGYDADGNVVSGTISVSHQEEIRRTFKSSEFAPTINNLLSLPEKQLCFEGDCSYLFAYGKWNWFVDAYGDKITTKQLNNVNNMFTQNQTLKHIPFEFNFIEGGVNVNSMFASASALESVPSIDFKQTTAKECNYMFNGCNALKEIGTLKNMCPKTMNTMFGGCYNLRYLPQFENFSYKYITSTSTAYLANMFKDCYSLRSVDEEFLKNLKMMDTNNYYYYYLFYGGFKNCYCLDEIKGLNPVSGIMTSNMFSGAFDVCSRVKNIMFALQDDGSPYVVRWKSQKINLGVYIGYIHPSQIHNITGFNSGIDINSCVTGKTLYDELKDTDDWFTQSVEFSRYNHDSAVNTINTLPDTSAFLATQSSGTNTITFNGVSGKNTDGGAINTLTEEEIAVATAKGWTVSFV